MKTVSTPSVRTKHQETKFTRMMEDINKHVTAVVLKKVKGDRRGWQRALERGDEIRDVLTDAALLKLGEFTAPQLRYVKSVPVAGSEEFVITEQLLREKYNFGAFGNNFCRLFFGKALKKVLTRVIAIHQLNTRLTDKQIKDELGNHAITSFAYALSLVEKQREGEDGPLLTNGHTNLMVVEVEEEVEENGKKVTKNSVWAVRFVWSAIREYWSVGAHLIGHPDEWHDAGRQVVSCDSKTM